MAQWFVGGFSAITAEEACTPYLREGVSTVTVEGEFLLVKADVMSIAVDGTDSVTLMGRAFPFSRSALTVMWTKEQADILLRSNVDIV